MPPRRSWDPDPQVMAFYARAARDWFALEVPGLQVAWEAQRLVFGRFQLRLLPGSCRWVLLERRRGWRLVRPGRPCLGLTDWLAQVRQVVTLKAGRVLARTETEN